MARVVRWDGDGLNDQYSNAGGIDCSHDEIIVKQADKAACDINNILKRYEKTGALPDMIRSDPQWGDFSDVPSFQQALEIVDKAEEQFAALDGPIRARFGHDPAKFLEFVTNPANLKEMRDMGLAAPLPPPNADPNKNSGDPLPPSQPSTPSVK